MVQFRSKENIPGNVFFPHEKLGSVPDHHLIDGKENSTIATQKKLFELELQMCSGDGEKRVAIIGSTNDKKSIISKKLSYQIQKFSGTKRSHPPLKQKEGIDQSNKKPLYDQTQSTFNEAQRLGLFNGDSKLVLTKKEIEREFKLFVSSVDSIKGVNEVKIFDSCPEVVEKIKTFLRRSGVDRNLFSRSLKIQGKTLNSFLLGKNQDKCDNITYKNAYVFFEKLRIYLGESKSESRCINEVNYPDGFTLKKAVKKSIYGVVTKETLLCPSVHELC